MQLHLVLPGLLWPSKVLQDTASGLDLPALSWLLGRGHLSWQPPRPPEYALCAAFGIDAGEPPSAALRLLGEGGTPGDDIWICADPVHLSIERRRMTLSLDAPPADADETREIVAALAPHFAENGEFIGGVDGHCYLRLKQMPDIATTPPSAVGGYATLLPQGGDALRWRQLANEAQMLMHALPCNAQRDRVGQPRLNSLCFWGLGRLPTGIPARSTRVCGEDPVLRGLARLTGVPIESCSQPESLLREAHGHTLLLLDTLQAPARTYDALRWREALLDLERIWLQPLRNAISGSHLSRLHLTALGDEGAFELELRRGDRLHFWRRPQPLHTLHQPHQPSTSGTAS